MRHTLLRAMTGLTLAAAIAVPAAAPASAVTPTRFGATVEQQRLVDGILAANPGAHQISATTAELQPGVRESIPAAAASPRTPARYLCSGGYLCLYENADYQGYQLALYKCGFVDLGTQFMPTSPKTPWYDAVSSVENFQTNGTKSQFYNWNGHWDLLYTSTAPDGDSWVDEWNDQADGVNVC
ncbi:MULTISPECIES: hypothetical protein [unclassified Amycolatopsis]|uniref:hypothetical protein n=1 Tax=unclassified Amycolatopsis TaxID=2618356 RepID=UPI0034528538